MSPDELGKLIKLLKRQPNLPPKIQKLIGDSSTAETSYRVARETESLEVRKFREYIKNDGIRNLIGQNFGLPTDEESLMEYFRKQPPEKQAESIGRLQFIFGDIEIPEPTQRVAQTTLEITNNIKISPTAHIRPIKLSTESLKTTKRNIIMQSIDDKYLQIPEFRNKLLKLLKIEDEEATQDEILRKYTDFSPKKQEKITKKMRTLITSIAEKESKTRKQESQVEIDPLLLVYLQNPEIKNELTELLGLDSADATTLDVIRAFSSFSPQLQELIMDDIRTKFPLPDSQPSIVPTTDMLSLEKYLQFPPVQEKLTSLLGIEKGATPEELMKKFSSLPPEYQSVIVEQMKAAFLSQPTPENPSDGGDEESSSPSIKQYLFGQLMSKPELMAELKTILTNSPDGKLDSEIFLAFVVRVLASPADGESPEMPSMSGNISQAELLSKFGVELPAKCPEGDDIEDHGSNLNKVIWLAIGQFIVGMGQTPFFPLGITYMDEALDDQTTPIFIGFVMMANQFGPVLGFFVSSFTLQRYVDFNYYDSSDINISIFDPRWVGAWWLGYVMLGCIMICYSFVFWFFPRKLPKHRSLKKKEIQKESNTSAASAMHSKMPNLKDLPKTIFRIMSNPVLPAVFLAIVFEISVVIALSFYAPKFLEQQYGLSKPRASMLFGFLIIPASCLGTFLGGLIVKRFKFTRLSCIRFVLCMSFVVISCYIALLASGCDRPKVAGVFVNHDGMPYGSVNGSSMCSADCQCPDQYMPVCGENKVTYYNPCQAGCTELSEEITAGPMGYPLRTFTNCSCVEGSQGPEPEGTAALLPCDVDCNTLSAFLAVTFIAVLFGSTSQNSLIMTIMWTAREEDRSLCLSIVSFLCRILGFIPAPIFIGALIDSTCEVWEEGCSEEQGSCLIYDTVNYRFAYIGMALAFKIGAFTLYVITLINLKRAQKRETQEATDSNKNAPYDYELAPQIDPGVPQNGLGAPGSRANGTSTPILEVSVTQNGKLYEEGENFESNSSENSESLDVRITTI